MRKGISDLRSPDYRWTREVLQSRLLSCRQGQVEPWSLESILEGRFETGSVSKLRKSIFNKTRYDQQGKQKILWERLRGKIQHKVRPPTSPMEGKGSSGLPDMWEAFRPSSFSIQKL
jgi:hypothetical protein